MILQNCLMPLTLILMRNPETTLFLGGGGSKEQSTQLDTALVEHVSRTRQSMLSVAYIPVAMEQRQERHSYPSCLEWFKDVFGNQFQEIEMWVDLSKLTIQDLRQKGAVYIGGGDTDVLMKHILDAGFDTLLKQYLQEGGTYYGGSAGAIILGKDLRTAEEVRNREQPLNESFDGLNLLGGYSVFPHFGKNKGNEFGEPKVKEISAAIGSPIIAIPEGSGIMITGNEMKVLGTEPISLFQGENSTSIQPNGTTVIQLELN